MKNKKTIIPQKKPSHTPWLSIWYSPRVTIRSAINNKSMNLAIFLAIVAGIMIVFRFAIMEDIASTMNLSALLVVIFLIGVISGLIVWFLGAAMLFAIGKWFNGRASFYEMLIALGIALIPVAAGVIICILDIIFLGDAAFIHSPLSEQQLVWHFISNCVSIILIGYSAILLVIAIAETQRFRIRIALSTLVIPLAIIVLFIYVGSIIL